MQNLIFRIAVHFAHNQADISRELILLFVMCNSVRTFVLFKYGLAIKII
jgi:hypothetical protein